jgi:hypothetical protein
MRINRDSVWLLAIVACAFAIAVALFTPLRLALSWDESVYASQLSHQVTMPWSPERARGIVLLIAPVALFTSSATAIRVYLTVLAGLGLFLALLAWRGVRPTWVLALAGVIFGALWITETQASRVYPNFWIAIGGLAGVGLYLRATTTATAIRWSCALLAFAAAFTALMRPEDAVFIFGPLLVVVFCMTLLGRLDWRRAAPPFVATVIGLVIGGGEWVAESYMYFGGPFRRLNATSRLVGGTKFNLTDSLRILSSVRDSALPKYPGITGWSDPALLFWWGAFLLAAVIGAYCVSRSRGWFVGSMPLVCAVSEYFLYTFPVRDNSRYLQPSWALLAVSAADGLAWLVTRPRGQTRLVTIAVAAAFLVVELVTQHELVVGQSSSFRASTQVGVNAADSLRQQGIAAPCLITTMPRPHFASISEPAAYYIGCLYKSGVRHLHKAGARRLVIIVQGTGLPWPYARNWPQHRLAGAGDVRAYVEPARPSG